MNLKERIGEGIVIPLENGMEDVLHFFFFLLGGRNKKGVGRGRVKHGEGEGVLREGKLPRSRQTSKVLTGSKWSPWQQ